MSAQQTLSLIIKMFTNVAIFLYFTLTSVPEMTTLTHKVLTMVCLQTEVREVSRVKGLKSQSS